MVVAAVAMVVVMTIGILLPCPPSSVHQATTVSHQPPSRHLLVLEALGSTTAVTCSVRRSQEFCYAIHVRVID